MISHLILVFRQLAIDKASKEKEDMERRMAEVEHLRSERKRLEEQAEKERQEKKVLKSLSYYLYNGNFVI